MIVVFGTLSYRNHYSGFQSMVFQSFWTPGVVSVDKDVRIFENDYYPRQFTNLSKVTYKMHIRGERPSLVQASSVKEAMDQFSDKEFSLIVRLSYLYWITCPADMLQPVLQPKADGLAVI